MRSAIACLRLLYRKIILGRQDVPDDLLADVGLETIQLKRRHDAVWLPQSRLRDLLQMGPR